MVTPQDAFADHVPAAERLPAPDPEHHAIAWQVAETNPTGIGFVRHWYWQASGLNVFPAPQIGYPHAPYDVAAFERAAFRVGERALGVAAEVHIADAPHGFGPGFPATFFG